MSRAALAAVLLSACAAGAADAPGVVGIYTSTGNVGGQGTGFLISASGEIATAYHVIHGAQRIDVSWGGTKYTNVVVARTYPDVDVAVLRIAPPPAGLTPLRLATKHKSWAAGDAVQVFGYSRGIANQRFDGTVTQSGAWTSQQIRDEQQRRLFRVDGIELVPLDMTIYSGLSGGPIVRGGEVIGILSGSLGQGRGIAWGIPVGYLPMAKPVERRASEIGGWPAFAMTRDWSTLRSSFRLDAAAARLIDEYFAAVDELVAVNDTLATNVRMARAQMLVARRIFEEAIARSPSGVPSPADSDVVGKLLFPALENVQKSFNRNGEAESKVQNVFGRILGYVEENYSGLPRTALNLRAAAELGGNARELNRRYAALKRQDPVDPALMDVIRTFQRIDAIDARDKAGIAAALREGLLKFEQFLAQQSGMPGVQQRNAEVRRYREIGEYVQSVFSRPQDLASEPQTYLSRRHGYTVTYPRGWVEWSEDVAKHLPLSPISGVDMYFARTGYFGDGRPAQDVSFVTTRGEIRPPGTIDDQFVASLKAAFEAKYRFELPGLRQVVATRTTLGPNSAILIRATVGSQSRPAWIQNAFVVGPGRFVGIVCSYRIPADVDDCSAIARSVRFN